jgi:hypothetical protein
MGKESLALHRAWNIAEGRLDMPGSTLRSAVQGRHVVLLAGGLLASTASVCAPLYRATDVGSVNVNSKTDLRDINDRAEGVGFSGPEAVAWTPEKGLFAYRQPPEEQGSFAVFVLNNRHESAGNANVDDKLEAVMVAPQRDPVFFLRGTWAEEQYGAGGHWPPIRDINDRGDVLGASDQSAWLWSASAGLRAIDDGGGTEWYLVNRVNDLGQVAGSRVVQSDARSCYGSRAFVYDDATRHFTPVDGGPQDIHEDVCARYSEATAINDLGQAVGYSNEVFSGDGEANYPFIWSKETGIRRIPNHDPGRRDFVPADINDRGQVVGTFEWAPWKRRFFYWDAKTGIVDLQDLLDPSDPLSAQIGLRADTYDIKINDRGVISIPAQLVGAPHDHWFLLFPQ